MLTRPNAPRIRELLRQDAELREDLATETDPDARQAVREELFELQHTLWLAGYAGEPDQ